MKETVFDVLMYLFDNYFEEDYEENEIVYDTIEEVEEKGKKLKKKVKKKKKERSLKKDAKLQPVGVQYERITVLQNAKIKEYEERITKLEVLVEKLLKKAK